MSVKMEGEFENLILGVNPLYYHLGIAQQYGIQTLASLAAAATLAGHDQVQKWDYDALNRVTAQTDQQNTVTQYTYDPLSGFLTSSVAAFGTADARTTNYKYDDLGRVIAIHMVANPDKLHAVADGVKHI